MTVLTTIAEVLTAAVVLIQDLNVVEILGKQGRIRLSQDFATDGRSGANIVARPLFATDIGRLHLTVRVGAHTTLKASRFIFRRFIVGVDQVALEGVAEARAVDAKQMVALV